MDCKEHLAGCFGPGYDFAGTPDTRLAALDYLRCNVENQNVWLEMRQDIQDYLRNMTAPENEIARQLKRAENMLSPWV
jgi:hypothetical protein